MNVSNMLTALDRKYLLERVGEAAVVQVSNAQWFEDRMSWDPIYRKQGRCFHPVFLRIWRRIA